MKYKILKQFSMIPYTVLLLDAAERVQPGSSAFIDGQYYASAGLCDQPHSAAILGAGSFVGKEIVFA